MAWFDGNSAEQQSVGGGPIPEGSIVKMRVEPLYQNDGSNVEDFLFAAKTGTKQLKLAVSIVSKKHEGRKWQEYYTLDSSKEKATKITQSRLRALLESARGIMPGDLSPAACAGREIHGPQELWGMECAVKLGVRENDGKFYNEIASFVTPDKEEYATVMAGEEVITDTPLPTAKAAPGAQPKWGAPAAVSQSLAGAATSTASTTSSTGAMPDWAKPK